MRANLRRAPVLLPMPQVNCPVEGCSKTYSTRSAMLLHSRKVHPGVEVQKFPPGPKAKDDNVVDGAASASERSLMWYHHHKDIMLAKRRQARLTGRVAMYKNYEEHRLQDLLSSVLRKIAQCTIDDGIALDWQSTIIYTLLAKVDKKYSVDLFPIFVELGIPLKMLTKRTQERENFANTFTKFKAFHPKLIMDLNALLSALGYQETQLDEVEDMSE